MELAEQLFRENNTLRNQLHELEKQFHARNVFIESIEEELWDLKEKASLKVMVRVSNILVLYQAK
jgi:hypothetical protein